MIVTLTGPNDYMRLAELSRYTAEFTANYGDFGIERKSAADMDFGRLLETVSSQPFLSSKRMVIVHDLSANKAAAEKIEQLLDSVSDTTDLIIEQSKFDKRLSIYKTLKKKTDFHEFTALDERGLINWLIKTAKTRGGSIKPNVAAYLISRVGNNQMLLSNELEKLLTYDADVTKTIIDLLSEPSPQGSVFELLDSAFSGNHKRAAALYEEQRKQQVEPQAIMGMIAWQLHALAVAKFNEKEGASTIASDAKMSPYTVNKALGLARRLSAGEVRDLVARALRLDVRLKSESINADDAVQHFLLTI